MAAKRLKAECLCGGVKIEADYETVEVDACHCETCRQWSAGPLLTLKGGENVVMAGTDYLGIYESSGWGERGFCRNCGTALFFRTKDGRFHGISAMAFKNLDDVKFVEEIFVDSKPDWYAFANDTKKLTGAEVLAQFTSDEG